MAKTYEITSINDLMAIPPTRVEECLRELAVAVAMAQAIAAEAEMDGELKIFKWTDDGKTDFNVNVKYPSGHTVDVAGDYKLPVTDDRQR